MAEIKVDDKFVNKYIKKITWAGTRYIYSTYLEVCKSIIKEVYEAGFKDGEKFAYKSMDENKVNMESTKVPCAQMFKQGLLYKCIRKDGTFTNLYWHGTPPGENDEVFTEHQNLSNSDWWYYRREFERFEISEDI